MFSAGLQYSMANSTDSTGGDGMSIFLWVLVVILFVVFVSCFVKKLAVASGDDFKDDNTYDLGENEVGKLIQSNRRVCVLAYAPWCSHCQRLAPIYEHAADLVRSELRRGKRARLASALATVDCTVDSNKDLCKEQHVQAFPTIRVYRACSLHPVDIPKSSKKSTASDDAASADLAVDFFDNFGISTG